MPARRGKEYLEDLRDDREVWVGGERIRDVARHPAFVGCARTVADLYDLQCDPDLRDALTYASPTTGDPVGLSFLVPRSLEDIRRRRKLLLLRADQTYGMLGRSPEFLNGVVTAFAVAREFFAAGDPRFGANVVSYYEQCRERDLCLTHAIVDPQIDRSRGPAEQEDPYLCLGVVKETDAGLVVRGARMLATLAPLADELLVYPFAPLTGKDARYALAFAIPISSPGLKLICREPFNRGRDPRDHPLTARFDEVDAVIVFDDVLIPWERVFLKGNVTLANQLRTGTPMSSFNMEYTITRTLVKAEVILGVASLMAKAIGVEGFLHIQEKLGEIVNFVELLRACLTASEAGARPWGDGVMLPALEPLAAASNLSRVYYSRMIETVQVIGAGGLMAMPPEGVLDGPVGADVRRYYRGTDLPADERIRLFRLAWDLTGEAFGQRQALYERYNTGDPVRLFARHYASYARLSECLNRVQRLLQAPSP